MSTPAANRAETLFHQARERPVDQRAAFLDGACGNDAALRSKVEALLAADAEAGSFLASAGNGGDATVVAAPHEQAGAMIGRYKLLQPIGEGGFGIVWMAEQKKPVKRRVALKIIKLGMDTKQVIARFEAERQALAMMNHPNIATVLDAGATETGRPYFVMELVKGIPITEYCDQNNLTVHQRLNLFKLVCAAVQHAHQKGIIHRDIKPSNVLVTLHDGQPVPKVIDFGIAKATNAELTEKTLFTEHRQMVGTPQYMSPEQAEMSGLDIDTRSDIYALGVLLYELLTGTTPFDPKRLRSAGLNEIQRIIREEEPHKPSTRLSTLDTLASIAAHRGIEPRKLGLQIRGDLDWIIMKALEKDRTRRYDTAAGFAADVQRHLDDEPVVAGPPSAGYRLRKFVRRNRRSIIGAIVIAAVLLIATAISIGFAVSETHQRRVAQAAEREQSRARQEAEIARHEAEQARTDEATQRRIAEAKTVEAQTQRDAARQQSYLSSIFAADAAIQSNEITTARSRLEAAPPELRNWEWNYLHAALDQSITPVLVEDGVEQHIIAISPDATRAVTRIVEGVHTLWNLDTDQPIAHFSRVAELLEERPLEFSPDGTRIVAILDDKTARIWDTATGEQLAILRGHEGEVSSVGFNPDMTRVVTTSGLIGGRNTTRIWDAATGEQLAVIPKNPGRYVRWASFSPDGSRIVIASWNCEASIWDATTGERIAGIDRYQGHHGFAAVDHHVQPALFSPDGKRIVTVSAYETARVFDAATGKLLVVFREHDSQVRSASFSPDGTHIVTASGDKTARIWDAATGEQLAVLRGHDDAVNAASFSPDGTRVVTCADDKTVRTWDATTGEPLAVYRGHDDPVYSAAFTPDGTRIVSAFDHASHIWDATTADQLLIYSEGIPNSLALEGVKSVSFSPDGTRIMTNHSAGFVTEPQFWDAATGEQLVVFHVYDARGGVWNTASLSSDGTRIVTVSNERTARIWDTATGEQLAVFHVHDSWVHSASFSPDGTHIVTASSDKTARIWDAATGEQLVDLRGHDSWLNSASFSPDGTQVVTASGDKTARIWDAATGEQLVVLRGHGKGVSSASFNPSGSRLVTASGDNTARIWDAATGEHLVVLDEHENGVNSASFSPDGTRIVTASWDNTARVWDAATGEQLLVLRGHEFIVYSASFSPDGKRIVTGHDSTIRIWDSVPYAQRYHQKQEYEKAEPKAVRVLDVVMATAPRRDGIPDLRAVAESIRIDSAIDESVRHVALNLLMRRADNIQSKARKLIYGLENYFVLAADIQAAVQSDASHEPAVHAAAIRIARWIEDSPHRLNDGAWRIVDDDDRSPADYERAQRAAESAFQSHPTSVRFAGTLAKAWTRLDQADKAIEVWREHVDTLRQDIPTDDSRLANSLIAYGTVLLKNDQAKDAEPVLRECLSIREKGLFKSGPGTKEARRVLAECLTKLARFTEAEALLIELANAVLGDDTSSEDRTTEAIQRVVDLYEAWHAAEPGQSYDAKAAQWRARLPQSPDRSGQEEEGDE